MDFTNMNAKKVMVLTDKTIAKLRPMKVAIEALEREGIKYEVYDKVRVEPKDYSVQDAIEFGKKNPVDAFLAVGGGSVMDTAKIVNLYTTFPDANFLYFVCFDVPLPCSAIFSYKITRSTLPSERVCQLPGL